MDAISPSPAYSARDYKSESKPVWCPGCGDYSVLSAITKALAALSIAPENVALVSGIGCSSRLPAYTNLFGFHGVHGRALPTATGIKLSRPELTVIAVGGDGDGFSIGGNHFLHACRRNLDMTYIVMDNEIYGMTKGQASPTTAPDWENSKLTPEGTGINAFQPLAIALVAGANFVARGFSTDPNNAARMIADAIRHPGFSFVQLLSPCVTFRPEQRDWRKVVRPAPEKSTDNRVHAALRMMDDDGFNIGVLYRGNQLPFQPSRGGSVCSVADLEKEFVL